MVDFVVVLAKSGWSLPCQNAAGRDLGIHQATEGDCSLGDGRAGLPEYSGKTCHFAKSASDTDDATSSGPQDVSRET